jgi:hypothetical protein
MENILLKYNKLDQFSQQVVDELIELLIQQQAKRSSIARKKGQTKLSPGQKNDNEPTQQPRFDYQAYRSKLLTLRTWSAEDIKAFDENLALFRNMKMTSW